jgi:hypothetical protein
MTAGELRMALEGIPDDLEVLQRDEDGLAEVHKAAIASVQAVSDDDFRLCVGKIADGAKAFFLIN